MFCVALPFQVGDTRFGIVYHDGRRIGGEKILKYLQKQSALMGWCSEPTVWWVVDVTFTTQKVMHKNTKSEHYILQKKATVLATCVSMGQF